MSDECAMLIFTLWAFATGHWIVGLIAFGILGLLAGKKR